MEGGGWRVEGGGWRVEGGGWRVEGGGRRVEGGGRRVEGGEWSVMGGWWRGEIVEVWIVDVARTVSKNTQTPCQQLIKHVALLCT